MGTVGFQAAPGCLKCVAGVRLSIGFQVSINIILTPVLPADTWNRLAISFRQQPILFTPCSPINASTHLSIHTSTHSPIHLSLHPYIHICIHPSIHPLIHLSTHLSIQVCIQSALHSSIPLTTHLPIHPSTHLSSCPFNHLSHSRSSRSSKVQASGASGLGLQFWAQHLQVCCPWAGPFTCVYLNFFNGNDNSTYFIETYVGLK